MKTLEEEVVTIKDKEDKINKTIIKEVIEKEEQEIMKETRIKKKELKTKNKIKEVMIEEKEVSIRKNSMTEETRGITGITEIIEEEITKKEINMTTIKMINQTTIEKGARASMKIQMKKISHL